MSETSPSLCNPTTIFYYPVSQQFSKTIYIFVCVVNVITSVSSILGNVIILSALRRCQSLHSPSKALLCSLALTDLVVGLVVLPLFVTYHLTIILEIPTYYCTIAVSYGRTSAFVSAASLLTIVAIAAERFLAFHLRSRYRAVVTFQRVVFVLILEWIVAAIWTVSWFWNLKVNMLFGAVVLFCCCVAVPLCYYSIHRGLRRHVAQVHQQASTREPSNFNVLRYKKALSNMMWIYAFLIVCYIPFLSSLVAVLVTGLNNTTRLAVQFSAIAIFFNSALNPVLYCWRIKELRDKVRANYATISNFFSSR